MNKNDLIFGFIIGITASLLGSFIVITYFTHLDLCTAIEAMKSEGKLGKIITLGSILDLVAFAFLLKINKELMARGVVLAVITLTIITLLI